MKKGKHISHENNEAIHVPKVHDTQLDDEYGEWLNLLKDRYVSAQSRAVVKVNGEKLLWKWQLGREIVLRKAEQRWGTGIVEQLSFDLQAAFPNEKGFGSRNLWYMKQWYLFYSTKLKQPVSELVGIKNTGSKLKQPVSVLEVNDEGVNFPPLFSLVSWGHHVEILKKCASVDEALFYLKLVVESHLSRPSLLNCIKADLFHKAGKAETNFKSMLPFPQAELAQEITKEIYDFGFIELPKGYKESQLETALTQQMTRFLLELGKGFAFVGRQQEIIISGRSRRIDLLFYHIYLRCYIVIELKTVPFEPEFAGKLNYYVAAVDEAIKRESDNPTIGLLICSSMDKTDVQLAFRGVTTPLGVAAYENVHVKEIIDQLPTLEQLQERVRLVLNADKNG